MAKPGFRIRSRGADDVSVLGAILEETRLSDGYPPHWPATGEFLVATTDELDAVVMEDADAAPVGHVALHERSARSVVEVATSATGLPAERLAFVARLFVRPSVRQYGLGRELLHHATSRAHALGLQPVLDVWEGLPKAQSLYRSAGWHVEGSATIRFPSGCTEHCVHHGDSIESLVLVGPAIPSAAASDAQLPAPPSDLSGGP